MHASRPPTTGAATSTYTTIPISGPDVISRSFQNLSSFVSRRRPWSEFITAASAFDRPDSFSGAWIRLRRNARYFFVNYGVILCGCAALSLIGSPFSLIIVAAVFLMWLVIHFFREDPMVVWGHHVSDRIVIVVLILVSAAAVWFTGIINNLLIGIGIGIPISAVHGVLRNPEDLFLDENDAISNGLIGSPISNPNRIDFRH